MQFLNAALGGTLGQALPPQTELSADSPSHEVIVELGTPLAYMLNSQTLKVIDCPHQEIKDLSPILRRMAYAESGAIEAVYMPLKRFIWAVQWHPELSSQTDKANSKIFEAFIMYAKLCRN